MSTIRRRDDPKYLKAYDSGMLRSAFVSLFWGVIMDRRKRGPFTMLSFAKKLGANKGEVSRWFSTQPNWTINTISNVANALNLDIQIRAIDRSTGVVYAPSGIDAPYPTYGQAHPAARDSDTRRSMLIGCNGPAPLSPVRSEMGKATPMAVAA